MAAVEMRERARHRVAQLRGGGIYTRVRELPGVKKDTHAPAFLHRLIYVLFYANFSR